MDAKITVIIPCYNEVNTIEKILDKVRKVEIKKQIIVVDDCSSDGTKNILKNKLKDKIDLLIEHKQNYGKGKCIITAKPHVLNDIVIIQDADLEYNPVDYHNLIEPIVNKRVKVVYGSRVLNKKNYQKKKSFLSQFRIFGNHILTNISNFINDQKLTDAHTCYKVFAKKLFDKIHLNEVGFNFCPEITTKISNLNEKIEEVPIDYYGR